MGMRRRNYTNIENYSFEDLVDLDKIQELQDNFSQAMGIGMVMTAPDGTLITRNSNACDFCHRIIRSTELGVQNCMKSDSIIGRPNKDGPVISKCLCGGLLDAGASIVIGDIHVASWMMGQVQDADHILTEEENRRHAEQLGIDPELYCSEIEKVPRISRDQFEKIAQLVYTMAKQLSELGLKNYIQKEELQLRNEMERKLTYSSQHDPLTNLYNRMYYESMITELITRDAAPVSVIVADVNYLKLSNDIFGHTEGDCLLQQISGAFVEEGKPEYISCRCGGDEFYVLMPGVGEEEAKDYVERVRSRCAGDYCTVLPPSLAIGQDTRFTSQEPLMNVIKRAEDRMYLDKHRIKSQATILNTIRGILHETGYISTRAEQRSKRIAMKFAKFLKLDATSIENIERLLEIQYLGLIIVPKGVLSSANNYIDYELEVRYNVTEIEYRLSKMFDSSLPIARIITQRYEQWDGNGRPNQLKGDQTDYLARFMSVVNSYTIITGDRPHGFGKDKLYALTKIVSLSGNILDPAIVDSFMEFMKYSYDL